MFQCTAKKVYERLRNIVPILEHPWYPASWIIKIICVWFSVNNGGIANSYVNEGFTGNNHEMEERRREPHNEVDRMGYEAYSYSHARQQQHSVNENRWEENFTGITYQCHYVNHSSLKAVPVMAFRLETVDFKLAQKTFPPKPTPFNFMKVLTSRNIWSYFISLESRGSSTHNRNWCLVDNHAKH